ncbi:hypothetical protein [Citreimonas salinaria]|uniref:Uncharacterized protein n=1 Tax=Citreimonas salinaria TaxID=321339 RepID=A0A1H3MGS3_9RHOB|nr:hypothetical protein [Citreimonas salinaria]SDY75753.1 hypothetical protein SAMN05444340_11713 [Citreimonas salinaria]
MTEQITLNIEGQRVKVGSDFLSLSPQDQEATVEEIARSLDVKPTQGGEGFMPNLNRGIANTVDFLNPFDQPHALNPFPNGASARGGMERLGIDVAEGEPQTVMEGFARGSGEAAAALVPVAKGLQALRGVGGAVGQFADDAYRSLLSVTGSGAEVVAGGVSGAAQEKAEQEGAPEWLQTTAAVMAPMGIPAAGAVARGALGVAGNMPVGSAIKHTGRGIAAAAAPYTKTGAREVARRRLVDLSGGTERAAELGERITPDNPLSLTPAQQTGDERMIGIEQLAASQDGALRERLDLRADQSRRTAVDQIQQPGDIQDTRAFFETRRREFANDLQARADDIIATTTRRVEGLGPQRTESENSLQVANQLNRALEDATMRERELWDAVPRGAQVPVQTARQTAQRLIAETPRAQRNDVPRVLSDLLGEGGEFGDVETVAEMHGLYSELRRVARSAMSGNDQNKNRARIANQAANAILRDLGAIDGTTDIGRQINEARAFSSALHETFDRGAVGRLMKRTIDGDTSIDPELALKRTVGRGGAEGMVGSRQIEEGIDFNRPDQDVLPQESEFVGDYIRDRFQQAAITPTGEFSNRAAAKFLRDNRELLDRYPGLKDDVSAAVKARDDADAFAQRVTARIQRLENARLSAGAALLNGSPDQALRAFTEARNPVRAARSIVNEARKDPSGQALSGLKSVLSRELIDGSATTGEGVLKALENPKLKAALRQVFTEPALSRLRRIGHQLAKLDNARKPVPSVGSSLSGASTNQMIETVARIKAAQLGGNLSSGGNMGGSLQSANILSSRVRDVLGRLTADRASQMLADAVEDPELFKALLTNPSMKLTPQKANRLLPYLIGGGVAAGVE